MTTILENLNSEENYAEYDEHILWLEEIGLDSLVNNYKAGNIVNDKLLKEETIKLSLTKQQIKTIRKRVSVLNWDKIQKDKSTNTHNNVSNPEESPLDKENFLPIINVQNYYDLNSTHANYINRNHINIHHSNQNYLNNNLNQNVKIDRKAAHRHRLAREKGDDLFSKISSDMTYSDSVAFSGNKGVIPLSFSPKLDLNTVNSANGCKSKGGMTREDSSVIDAFADDYSSNIEKIELLSRFKNNGCPSYVENGGHTRSFNLDSPAAPLIPRPVPYDERGRNSKIEEDSVKESYKNGRGCCCHESPNNVNKTSKPFKKSPSSSNFELILPFHQPDLQMCHYNDLSLEDLAGLQRLALIELTIIFDRHRLRVSHISAHKLKALRRKERQDRLKSSNKCHIESPCCYRDDQAERENQNNRDIYSVAEARLKQGGFNGGRPNNGTNQPPLAYSSIPADGGINNGTMFQSYFDSVGCCLEEIVAKERKFAPLTTVPSLFESMIRYLEQNGTKEEGIFRVPGSLHRIKSLIKAINDNRQIDFSQFFRLNNSAANDIAALLKMYLRELPEPLLTRKHVLNFSQISKISALEDRIKALNYLIILLPDVNNRTLRMLIRFLNRISLHQNQNKMTTDNIATIMAPNIFPEEVLSSFSDPSSMKVIASNHNNGKGDKVVQGRRRRRQLDQAMRSCNIIKSMLTYEHQLWMVPDELLNQHRLINDTKNRKNKRKNPSDYHAALTNKIFDFNQEMIDIEISIELMGQNFRKIITTPINHSTAIKDVVGNCKKFLNMDSWRRIGLFETGGNIGERYLNQNLVLVNVMKSNPTCNLVLKEIK